MGRRRNCSWSRIRVQKRQTQLCKGIACLPAIHLLLGIRTELAECSKQPQLQQQGMNSRS